LYYGLNGIGNAIVLHIYSELKGTPKKTFWKMSMVSYVVLGLNCWDLKS